jgi:hypothetical protein
MNSRLSTLSSLALCIFLIWCADCFAQTATTEQAIEQLEKASGKVAIAPNGDIHVELKGRLANKEIVLALKAIAKVRSLDLERTGVDDKIPEQLSSLKELHTLRACY